MYTSQKHLMKLSDQTTYRLAQPSFTGSWDVGGTVASESALRSTGTLLSRVRAQPPAPWPDGGPESLKSPCGQAIYKNLTVSSCSQCKNLIHS
ncbi:hypothetical protein PoB_004511900 [Plakobranchus ocellatus]|uniref:Uncharacterized protein n=1 Tax=Plakobranchus ocellatus TaxID=259542 RepID=A0AAV4BJX7_9GAST|nr:hypothetical protein PoB_004511900 [Plakobranchus ocellatus]